MSSASDAMSSSWPAPTSWARIPISSSLRSCSSARSCRSSPSDWARRRKELGATVELTAGTRRWLDVVAAHAPSKAPNIGVRGEFSQEQVERSGVPRPRSRDRLSFELHQSRSVPGDRARRAVSAATASSALPFPRACIIGRNSARSSGRSRTSWNQPPGSMSRNPKST